MQIEEIKRALALRMEALAHELIDAPLTYQRLHELRFGRRQSLSVRIGGTKAGTFADFSGNAKGDAIAFIMHMRQCTTGEALAWASTASGRGCPAAGGESAPMA